MLVLVFPQQAICRASASASATKKEYGSPPHHLALADPDPLSWLGFTSNIQLPARKVWGKQGTSYQIIQHASREAVHAWLREVLQRTPRRAPYEPSRSERETKTTTTHKPKWIRLFCSSPALSRLPCLCPKCSIRDEDDPPTTLVRRRCLCRWCASAAGRH